MNGIDLNHARSIGMKAVEASRTVLIDGFRNNHDVITKGHADYVTELDHKSQEIIQTVLAELDDSVEFIGEETSEFEVLDQKVQMTLPDTCWIVDPLDGTSNYAHGFNGFSISIALRVNKEIVLGIVDAPVLNETYVATRDGGAFLYSGSSEIKLNTFDRGDDINLIATSAPFRYPTHIDSYMKIYRKVFDNFEDVRRVGSAELDLAWVSNGSWAAYFEMFLKPWDSSAGSILVTEAGGTISDWSGDEIEWLNNGLVLASANRRIHDIMLKLINE